MQEYEWEMKVHECVTLTVHEGVLHVYEYVMYVYECVMKVYEYAIM